MKVKDVGATWYPYYNVQPLPDEAASERPNIEILFWNKGSVVAQIPFKQYVLQGRTGTWKEVTNLIATLSPPVDADKMQFNVFQGIGDHDIYVASIDGPWIKVGALLRVPAAERGNIYSIYMNLPETPVPPPDIILEPAPEPQGSILSWVIGGIAAATIAGVVVYSRRR